MVGSTRAQIAIFPEKEKAEIVEMTLPPLEADQILVKTHYSGMYSNEQAFEHFVAHTRELTAYFPYSTRYGEIEETLRAQASGLLNTKPFLTHTYGPDQVEKAFSLFSDTPDDMVSICVDWIGS